MSQENVEAVRRIYEDGVIDLHAELAALLAPDVEYVNPPEAVDPGTRRGKAEVLRAFKNIEDNFDSTRYELHELFDAGDSVVASISFFARGRGSETEVEQAEAHTWTFRSGGIVRFEWCRDLPRALEGVGLAE